MHPRTDWLANVGVRQERLANFDPVQLNAELHETAPSCGDLRAPRSLAIYIS